MESKDKNIPKKSGKSSFTIVMYITALIVAILAITLLVDNIYLFRSAVNQYVAQGYPATTVTSQLIPSQLLPGIIEPVAGYGGVAFVLFGIGIINKKISKHSVVLTENDMKNKEETDQIGNNEIK